MFVRKTSKQLEKLVGEEMNLELNDKTISGKLIPAVPSGVIFVSLSFDSVQRVRFETLPQKHISKPILRAQKYLEGTYFKDCPGTGKLYDFAMSYFS